MLDEEGIGGRITWVAIVYPSSGWKWGVLSFDLEVSDFFELDEEEGEG